MPRYIEMDADSIRRHLQSGKPAIFDMRVKKYPEYEIDALLPEGKRGSIKGNNAFLPATTAEEKFSDHAVVALSIFEDPVTGKSKVLILDSANGWPHVWDFDDCIKAMEEIGATLLSPKEQKAKKRAA